MKKISDMAYVMTGKKCETTAKEGHRLIRITDTQPFSILGEELVYIEDQECNQLCVGDIMLPRTGDHIFPFLVSKEMLPVHYSSFHFVIRPWNIKCSPMIYYQMHSAKFHEWINQNKKGRNITKDIIEDYEILMDEEIPYIHFIDIEKNIRINRDFERHMEQIKAYAAQKFLFSKAKIKLGQICFKVMSTNVYANEGTTPVYDIDGICGYTDKCGYETDVVAIQRNGYLLKTIIIPKGCIGYKNLLCLEPLIPAEHLKLILDNCNLQAYLTKGSIPHLQFHNIKDIKCCYDSRTDMKKFELLEQMMQVLGKERECLEQLFFSKINKYFSGN